MSGKNNLNLGRTAVGASDSQHRAIFNAIQKDRPDCVITKSYLRSEVALTAATGTVRFPILVNDQPAANVNERRLNIADEFQVVEFGIFLYKVPSGEVIDEEVIQTYPNPSLFSKSGETRALQALYNGFFTITINRKQIIPYYDCLQFLKIPDSQQGTTSAAIAGPTTYTIAKSAYLNANWGLNEVLPTFRISGAVVNEINLVANPKDMTGTSSTNYVVFFARGFLIQNGAKFNSTKADYDPNNN